MSDTITNTTNTNESKVFNVYVSKSTTAGTALVTRGSLNKTDTAPTVVGLYILEETGVYTNLGGIDAQSGKLNFASFDGTTWSLIAVDLPQPIVNNYITENTYNLDPNQIVPSEALYNDPTETLAGDIIKRVDINTGENVNYRETTTWHDSSQMDDSKVDGVIYIKKGSKYYKRQFENKTIYLDWFSPKKDGISDDADVFQNAVDYLKLIGGGTLIVSSGDYAVSHVDFFSKEYSNISIFGNNATIIQKNNGEKVVVSGYPLPTFARFNASDGIFCFDANVSNQTTDENSIKNIKIKGFTFISDVVNDEFDELSHQITMHGVSDVEISDCKFIGFLGDGIAITRGRNAGYRNAYNKDVRVLNCFFDGINNDNRQGVSFYYCDGFKVDFCTFQNVCRPNMIGAIDVEADDNLTRSGRGIISNNKFKNIGGIGAVTIFLQNWSGTGISHNGYIIENNDFEDCLTRAITIMGNAEYLNYKGNYGVVIQNNRIYNVGSFLWLDKAFGVKVLNNYFKKMTSLTSVIGYNGVNKILFENNVFSDVVNPSGFAFLGYSKNIEFIRNDFNGFKSVFLTINDSKAVKTISENNFYDTEAVNYHVLITANSATPEDFLHTKISNNNYGNSLPINLNFWTNGASYPTTATLPNKFVYGDSENQMTGTMPSGFVGDGTALVKTIRRNVTSNYYPEIYQTLYPAPNNGGNVWIRQAIDLNSWGDWKLISNAV